MTFNPSPFSEDWPRQPQTLHHLHLLQVNTSMCAASQLEIAIWQDICVEFSPFCLIMLPSDVPKLPPDPTCEGVSFCLEASSPSGLPTPKTVIPVLKYFVSLFCLYLLFYLIQRRLVCLSGYLWSPARIQKLLCGNCSTYRWSFDVFVGEKLVSLSYSSAILKPPPVLFLNLHFSDD